MIPRIVANYFMPPFEPSAEIQLSGPLCSVQDWREDNGRGQLEGLRESITARKTHYLAKRLKEFIQMLRNTCLF